MTAPATPAPLRGASEADPHGRFAGAAFRTAPSRIFADRAAAWVVRAGGVAVVLSLVGILVFLLAEVLPLLGKAELRPLGTLPQTQGVSGALIADPHRTHLATLDPSGVVIVRRLEDGSAILEQPLLEGTQPVLVSKIPGEPVFAAATDDGRIVLARVSWGLSYQNNQRIVTPSIDAAQAIDLEVGDAEILAFSAREHEGSISAAAALDDGSLVLARLRVEENDFTGEREELLTRWRQELPAPLVALAIDPDQRVLYGASERELLWWSLDGDDLSEPDATPVQSPITAISLLIGGQTLVVGHEDGSLDAWFRVARGRAGVELVRAHEFHEQSAPIEKIAGSQRDRSFLALDASGEMGLYHSTSGRQLWSGRSPVEAPTSLALGPKGDAAFLASDAGIARLEIDNPHAETGFTGMWRRVWYEGHQEPAFVWQSTGGTGEFEPKLSLTPLMLGTLKGTAYALIFAIPLGILGALYTSQLMAPQLQRVVKPTVEIMASLPSVVLGFLAGLWLAPRLEQYFPALILMFLAVPLISVGAGALWQSFPRRFTGRFPDGVEMFFCAGLLVVGLGLCLELNDVFENLVFGGDFPTWLRETTGLDYDQRNAVVAGIAMGFAVIPIIFAISEDALSNVPRSLSAASLALGASRWQTLARVVLPAASPGLFAAVMIGFGRAVGETMIVLMATGNTPVLDWNAFNGFRTLSANIAVEIPEAPHGGTLYRTLFLSALVLFAVTFVLNTAAELVRARLRRRYSEA